jgi:uncharacterized protein
MSYKGKVVVEAVDEANHSARLAASGRDTKGAGTARANVETRLEPAGDTRTRLLVTSDVQLTGKVASFGRGGAINDVATRLFGQFADCLRATLEAEPATAGPGAADTSTADTAAPAATGAATGDGPAATTDTAPAATTPASTAAPAADQVTSGPAGTTPAPAAPATSPPTTTTSPADATTSPAQTAAPRPAATPPPRAAEALDAGSLAGTVIKGRLRALFQAIAGFFRRLVGGRRSRT